MLHRIHLMSVPFAGKKCLYNAGQKNENLLPKVPTYEHLSKYYLVCGLKLV